MFSILISLQSASSRALSEKQEPSEGSLLLLLLLKFNPHLCFGFDWGMERLQVSDGANSSWPQGRPRAGQGPAQQDCGSTSGVTELRRREKTPNWPPAAGEGRSENV